MFTKTIHPSGLAELHDGQILLHAQVYPSYSAAELALDRIIYDILSDQHERGLIDDLALALEAEGVTSMHVPGYGAPILRHSGLVNPLARIQAYERAQAFCSTCGNDGDCPDCDALATAIVTTMVHRDMQPVCADPTCHGPHHIQQCPQVIACLFAPIDDYAECASCGDIFGRNSADPLPSICAACREWAGAEIAAHRINMDAAELDTDRIIIGGMVLDALAA